MIKRQTNKQTVSKFPGGLKFESDFYLKRLNPILREDSPFALLLTCTAAVCCRQEALESPGDRVHKYLAQALTARSIEREKSNNVNFFTLRFKNTDKEKGVGLVINRVTNIFEREREERERERERERKRDRQTDKERARERDRDR